MSERTTSFTPGQKEIVDVYVMRVADKVCEDINSVAPGIQVLDERPRKTYSPSLPDVFFPYVNQAILEDLIAELQSRV